jgi:protease secretion system membrane fusion protein
MFNRAGGITRIFGRSKRGEVLEPLDDGYDASDDAAMLDAADPQRHVISGVRVLVIGFVGFIAFAALVPLDEGVPTTGTVTVSTKLKPIQYMPGGILREILVQEGQAVKVGQVLARMEDEEPRANFIAAQQRYLGLSAAEARLLAELSGGSSIAFGPELMSSIDPSIQQQVTTQQSLFRTRKAALAAQVASAQGQIESARYRLTSLREEASGLRDLVREGYAPKARLMDLERQISATYGNISELAERVNLSRQQYRREAEDQLANVQLELKSVGEVYELRKSQLARTEIKSPANGQVMALQVQSSGAVLVPAQKLMDIVPQNEALIIEAKIRPQFVTKVKPGTPVQVTFSNLSKSGQLQVEGIVMSLSGDTMNERDPAMGQMGPSYLARIQITPAGFKKLGNLRPLPGMQVMVMMKSGSRTLLAYLMRPFTRTFDAALTE